MNHVCLQINSALIVLKNEIILDDADRLVARFSRSSEPSGVLKIGVVETIARTWLPTLLHNVQERYPNIKLEITTESTLVLHHLLKSASLLMCISVSPCDNVDISNEEICHYPMEWVANPKIYDPEHIYSRRDLIELPMIDYLEESPPALWLNRYFGEDFRDRKVNNTTNSMSTMIWLAENGLGIAAIPPRAIPQYIADGRLGVVKTNVPLDPMPFYLNYRTRPFTSVSRTVKSLVMDAALSISADHRVTSGGVLSKG